MPASTNVNNMTVVHKKSSGVAIAFPDVCKTPSPGGPVPIPYPNIAMSSDASKTSKKVKVDGEGIMVKGSNFSMSTGDEAGSAGGGVITSKIKGKAEFLNYSFDVKAEGKDVARLTDPMGQNKSSQNTASPAELQPPTVVLPGQKPGDPEACEQVEKDCHVDRDDLPEVATKHGMDPDHAEGIRQFCEESEHSATFRSTNTDCAPWIKEGFPAKGSDVVEKTIKKGEGRDDLAGLVGVRDDAGKLTGLMTTEGKVPLPKGGPPRNAYTGDYDGHDFFGSFGDKVPGGSDYESGMIGGLNEAIGRGEPGNSMSDMVRHGPQSNYSEWCKNQKPPKSPKPELLVPDTPVLAFDENGEVYLLETEDDLRRYYACKGRDVPEEWDWDEDHWKENKDKLDLGKKGDAGFDEFARKRGAAVAQRRK